jgi:hypothetical protein
MGRIILLSGESQIGTSLIASMKKLPPAGMAVSKKVNPCHF